MTSATAAARLHRKRLGRPEAVGLLFAARVRRACRLRRVPDPRVVLFSLCRYNIVRPPFFIGLENYKLLLFDDPLFWKSLWNTVYLTRSASRFNCLRALRRHAPQFRSARPRHFPDARLSPRCRPRVATAILWVWILNPEYGLINSALDAVAPGSSAIPSAAPAGSAPRLVEARLILVMIWASATPWSSSSRGSSRSARALRGRAHRRRGRPSSVPTRHPPMVSPSSSQPRHGIIGSFQYFTHVYVMTAGIEGGGRGAGGPEFSTLVYPLYLYQNAFLFFRMGYASAMAWILFILVALILVVIFRTSKWVYYEKT